MNERTIPAWDHLTEAFVRPLCDDLYAVRVVERDGGKVLRVSRYRVRAASARVAADYGLWRFRQRYLDPRNPWLSLE